MTEQTFVFEEPAILNGINTIERTASEVIEYMEYFYKQKQEPCPTDTNILIDEYIILHGAWSY